jgi:hypothetical protein
VRLRKVDLAKHDARIGNNGNQAHYRLKYSRKRRRCRDANIMATHINVDEKKDDTRSGLEYAGSD